MHTFQATLQKFGDQGEKTGWTYITIPAETARLLKPGNKQSFRVRGMLNATPYAQLALMPMGGGDFIMPLKAALRKALGKNSGEAITLQIEEDTSEHLINPDLISCLEDEPAAAAFFATFSTGTQRYYSNWIDSAKTDETKAKRIAQCLSALSRGLDYPQMIREGKKDRELLR